jgi:hypothetical protein
MNTWGVNELIQSIFIQSLNEVVQEHFILMRCMSVSLCELVCGHIIQLALLFAGTVGILALNDVQVYNANHGHSLGLILVQPLGEVSHVVHLYQCVYAQLELVYVRLH